MPKPIDTTSGVCIGASCGKPRAGHTVDATNLVTGESHRDSLPEESLVIHGHCHSRRSLLVFVFAMRGL